MQDGIVVLGHHRGGNWHKNRRYSRKANTMKRILIIILAVGLCANLHAQVAVDVSYQTFYDQLSPYGHWVAYPGYGYVWHPSAAAGFRPYGTAGHWAWTDEGWCWVSDYSWGW